MGVNLILAAGDSERWKGATPKQLMDFDGEPIIKRIIRQLPNALVVSHNPLIWDAVGAYYNPPARRWIAETLLSTQSLWNGRTRVFLGDVIYSDEAIATILDDKSPITVFGMKWEIFGLSFDWSVWVKAIEALKLTITEAEAGGRGKLWEFYRNYTGVPVAETNTLEDKVFKFINDWTNDIDTLEEYCLFLKENRPPGPNMSEILRHNQWNQ